MRSFLSFALRIFYRQIEVVGLEDVPKEGEAAVIFAGNHPNSLIDPALIITQTERQIHFAAKDVLFRSAFLRLFLSSCGAVPIRRRTDHGGGPVDNSGTFDQLFAVLAQGKAIGIFPEGISHDEAQLAEMKTGAARIALGLADKHPDLPVFIVPTGLTYVHRKHFRSRVVVRFGAAIEIDKSWRTRKQDDERLASRELTDHIESGLRAVTINAPDWKTLNMLDTVRRLYQPPKIPLLNRVELARRFALGYEQVKQEPEIVGLAARATAYQERLEDSGLRDRHIRDTLSATRAAGTIINRLIWFFFWLPMAAPGVIIHAPIGILVGFAGRRLTPRRDVLATTKVMIGMVLEVAVYGALLFYGWWKFGRVGLAALALALPLTGVATVKVLERMASIRRLMMRSLRSLTLHREVEQLRLLRKQLQTQVIEAVDRYIPDDMERLYPQTDTKSSQ